MHLLSHLVQFVKCWQIFLELNYKGQYQSSEKENERRCLVFASSTKCEIRHFHVVVKVVQRRQRKEPKSVMHVQSCCFANLNLLLFGSSRYCHHCRCLSSLVSRRFREVASYESRTAGDLHEEECGHIKFVVIHAVSKSSFHTLSNVVAGLSKRF